MKETKVYVDEFPKSCWDCFCQDNENGRCKILGKYTDYVPKDCPLIDIKVHDRELVKEVLEKVKNEAYKDGFYDENGEKIITYHISNYILDQIQKEIEDENNED